MLSLSATFSVYCNLCFVYLSQRQNFLSSCTHSSIEFCEILNVTSDHSDRKYFCFLVQKWLDITTCIKHRANSNFNLCFFMSSIIEGLNKSFSVHKYLCLYKSISYKFFCTNLCKGKLKILTNSSTIFRSSHQRSFMKKAALKDFAIFTRKQLC